MSGDADVIASGIFGFTCSSLIYKIRHDTDELDMVTLDKEIEKIFIKKLKKTN